ncbi:MAG: aminomethyl transferase family protein [Acidobacteria bacterium]|nr:MAG: aminomethyl transferase family protein [Acidobacteriota bacterium]
MMTTEKKKTPLFDWHKRNGANIVEFGDYLMPVWYGSARDEHLAVVTRAGLFDCSHMAVVRVLGPGAFNLLQWCFTRNLDSCVGKDGAPLTHGKCVYGVFLNERGEAVDDSIVYRIKDDEFLAVVNAGMGGVVAAHLEANKKDLDGRCVDLTDKLGKIDIQGPASIRTMQKVLKTPEAVFEKLSYFAAKGHFDSASDFAGEVRLLDGTPLLLSRSGYTGEVGFELFVEREHTVKLWETLIEAGRGFGLIPCGLAARDSLRTGAVLPLSHQDIGPWTYTRHPWPFALPLTADGAGFTKTFLGSNALEKAIDAPYTLTFVGNDLRKIDSHAGVVVDQTGAEIGKVLTCVTDVAIGRHGGKVYSLATPNKPEGLQIKGLSCGFIKVTPNLAPGTMVQLRDGKRTIPVVIETDVRPDRTARKALKNFL